MFTPDRKRSVAPKGRRTPLRVIIGFLIFLFLAWILYQIRLSNLGYFIVTSDSMRPTLVMGDRTIMERARAYRKGDVVTLEKPGQAKEMLAKRIVALGGDEVMMRRGRLYVNGEPDHPPGGEDAPVPVPDRSWTLKEGEVFVAGDNRAFSEDSRDFGPRPLATIHGVVRWRVESLFKWKAVK